MAQTRQATFDRLDALLKGGERTRQLPLDETTSYALFSDLHLGNGSAADNFVHNQVTFQDALRYYRDRGDTVILVGDVEELWQFDLHDVRAQYDDTVYALFRTFPSERLIRVHGNHDLEWGGMSDPTRADGQPCRWASEALCLGPHVLVTHGHQGELFSDKNVWVSRFAARLFRFVEPAARWFGAEDKSATKSLVPKDRERTYYQWAKDNRVLLLCGHTHRALFASRSYAERLKQHLREARSGVRTAESIPISHLRSELRHERARGRDIGSLDPAGDPLPCYFNSGCGGYRDGLTNLEIEGGQIRLCKWDAGRRKVFQEGDLWAFIDQVRRVP